ncbi:MAG TPA: antibiotic biosynthesis monooxygenase family protein [Actinomycetota bacterium]|nr:antibiotic biosynthesis monooxygenase family protein [Actinomycetota bacterium]
MSELFTCGRWQVAPGKEDEFVAAWRELADWTSTSISGAGWAKLLRDRENPNVFLSFGRWDSMGALQEWRSAGGFTERIGKMRGLLEDFEAKILETTAEIE